MAGKFGNKNAVGNSGGKSLQDRKLAASVRNLTLKKIKAILETPSEKMKTSEYELYKAILLRLAGSILPRLNEHTGDEGGADKVQPKPRTSRQNIEAEILEHASWQQLKN